MCCQTYPRYLICLDNPVLSLLYLNDLNTAGVELLTSHLFVSDSSYWLHPSTVDQAQLMMAIISTSQISRGDGINTASAQLSPLTDISAGSQLSSIAAID